MLERGVACVENSSRSEHVERRLPARDVKLVTRRPIERSPPVRADLRANPLRDEQGERASRTRAACKVEVQCPITSSAEMQAPGGVEQRRELREAVTPSGRGDSSELLSDVLGPHMRTPSSMRSLRLIPTPADPYEPMPFEATTR